MDGVTLQAAGFSNLSHDHLDYHTDMEDYLRAKARLFTELLPKGALAVMNADSEYFLELSSQRMLGSISLESVDPSMRWDDEAVIGYGEKGRALKIINLKPTAQGLEAELNLYNEPLNVTIPLVGGFQLHNILCAIGLVFGCTPPTPDQYQALKNALETLTAPRGRLQPIPGHPHGAGIYIDYAHTPDALETILTSLRPHTQGRLICLFGAGGDRDKAKRPLMGIAAANHADIQIITDDNPRFENPVDIRTQILSGLKQITHTETVFEIGDRAAAIDRSINMLKPGDVLVIAGKGHESGQIIGEELLAFDDAAVAAAAIKRINA